MTRPPRTCRLDATHHSTVAVCAVTGPRPARVRCDHREVARTPEAAWLAWLYHAQAAHDGLDVAGLSMPKPRGACSVVGCDRDGNHGGLCDRHSMAARRAAGQAA